jgi:hypothetical protein
MDDNQILLLKKKHNIPMTEEIYVLKVEKTEKELAADTNEPKANHWVTYLREPTLAEQENLLNIITTKMLTGTQLALQSLYLDGDHFWESKALIMSSMKFASDLFNSNEAIIEKK